MRQTGVRQRCVREEVEVEPNTVLSNGRDRSEYLRQKSLREKKEAEMNMALSNAISQAHSFCIPEGSLKKIRLISEL